MTKGIIPRGKRRGVTVQRPGGRSGPVERRKEHPMSDHEPGTYEATTKHGRRILERLVATIPAYDYLDIEDDVLALEAGLRECVTALGESVGNTDVAIAALLERDSK